MTASYWNKGDDPYQYAGSAVLKNILGIQDASALEAFEQRVTILRLDEAMDAIKDTPIDLALWQTIHRILFQDVYLWAGEIRSVQLAKGNSVFAIPAHIATEAERIFNAFRKEGISLLAHADLAARLAYYFGELNVLHPFREGNGRTQKLLFDEIARRAGYNIMWSMMSVDGLLQALIHAFQQQDYRQLENLFHLALHKRLS